MIGRQLPVMTAGLQAQCSPTCANTRFVIQRSKISYETNKEARHLSPLKLISADQSNSKNDSMAQVVPFTRASMRELYR